MDGTDRIEAKDVATTADVNRAIRETWSEVCRDFPFATTPLVAKRVAEEYGVSVSRVLEAFPASRDESSAASLYVCAECLNVLNQDETACAMACPDHPDAMRPWVEVPVSKEVIREVVEREYGV